ncbi:hypothetical protein [Streptococcus infantis]|uniref:hypothetical protein n=1 Tax=Streptococcus infantis TaxID=68892 RepID=UPI0039C1406E
MAIYPKKVRIYGLFWFFFRIKKDNFKNLLGQVWGGGCFLSKQKRLVAASGIILK